jgi:hypothetical protein
MFQTPLHYFFCCSVLHDASLLVFANNNLFFKSFGHSCTSSAQTHKFCNISTWFPCAAICKAVSSSFLVSSNSYRFSSTSLAQHHSASKMPFPAVRFHLLLRCTRRQPIISSRHWGLVASLWKHPADPLITLHCLYMLPARWRYFHPYLWLGINYSLTHLGICAVARPTPQFLYHNFTAIIHYLAICAISVILLQ